MKNCFTRSLFLAYAILSLAACQNETKQPETPKPVMVETQKIEKKSGPDCDKPDTLILNCVEISFHYPVIKEGNDSLKAVVHAWANDFMTSLVAYAEEPDNMPPLEEAIQGFIDMHDEMLAEAPDAPAYYVAETRDTVLLNDGKYLTLRMDGYNFAGGAHPNATSVVNTWETASGKMVKPEDLVTDTKALQERAEKKFREVKAELFRPESEGGSGFEFDEAFPFKLADNIGVVENGLFFCYVPYEVGSYAMGYTEFVLPFDEIKDLMK